MIFKYLSSTIATLTKQPIHFFCVKPGVYSKKSFLKNDNLIFEDHAYKMIAYFFLPEIRKTPQNAYEINRDSNALSLVWEGRQTESVKKNSDGDKNQKQGQQKTSFSFKYHQLQSLLEVVPKSGLRTTFERKRKLTHQYLTLADNPTKKAIEFTIKNMGQSEKGEPSLRAQFHFEFAYSKHRIFQILLKKSLFELSGMGMIYQIKREQQVTFPLISIINRARERQQIQKEVQEFYGK